LVSSLSSRLFTRSRSDKKSILTGMFVVRLIFLEIFPGDCPDLYVFTATRGLESRPATDLWGVENRISHCNIMADGLKVADLSLNASKHAPHNAGRAPYIPPHLRQRNVAPMNMDGAPPAGGPPPATTENPAPNHDGWGAPYVFTSSSSSGIYRRYLFMVCSG
jgi:hypothetical protein